MILELKIRNFLSFKEEVTFSFEATADKTLDGYYVVTKKDGTRILKMMMIYGANASGKSNLISAFQFLLDFVEQSPDSKSEGTSFIPFRFVNEIDKTGEFDLSFYVGEEKFRYYLSIDSEKVDKEELYFYPGTQPASVYKRWFDNEKNISLLTFGNKVKLSKQALEAIQLNTLKNASVFSAYDQVNVSIPLLDMVVKWFNEQYFSSIDPYTSLTEFSDREIKSNLKIKESALNFLKEADFNITDVIFEEKTRQIPDFIINTIDSSPLSDEDKKRIKEEKIYIYDEKYFKHKVIDDNKTFYYILEERLQSQGTLRYYGLTAPFFKAIEKNAFLPIDEIGSALHPLLVIHYVKEFLQRSIEAQLLFTTHNMSILNEKEILRKDAIWFTEKKENGSTELFSLADFNFRKELSYYNAYKIGKFGAIPEL